MESTESMTLRAAVSSYLGTARKKALQPLAQQELFRFAQWYGPDRTLSGMVPLEIEGYTESVGGTGAVPNASERLQAVKSFLANASKLGLTDQNLSRHIRIPRVNKRSGTRTAAASPETVELTRDGHAQLVKTLDRLKAERGPIAAEIARAAADKDVRENVPLEAAREQLGHLESRIREIEGTLKIATVIDETQKRRGQAIRVGSQVSLKEIDTGRELSYVLVSAWEANPLEGKISDVSPVGKALVARTAGQEIDVESPRGKLRYRILKVSP